jgi:hypothetical protein
MSASPSPSSSNPYATVNGISGVYLPLAGGTMTGDIGVNYNDLNQVTSIVFADNTVQTTASGAGVLLSSNNLSDLSNISTARTNLGLGSVATLNTSAVLQTANNLSEVTPATARTNLGLAYATDAQVIAGTATNVVTTPANVNAIRQFNRFGREFDFGVGSWTTASSGTPAIIQSAYTKSVLNQTNVGYGSLFTTVSPAVSAGNSSYINWDASYSISFLCIFSTNASTGSNNIQRIGLGKLNGVAGDLSSKGMCVRRIGTGALELQVHNGTTLTNVTSSFTPSNQTGFEVILTSDGTGNAFLYVNGSLVAQTTGAPTGTSGVLYTNAFIENQVLATVTTSTQLSVHAFRLLRSS